MKFTKKRAFPQHSNTDYLLQRSRAKTPPPQQLNIDIILQRCAWSAQILLFIAAIAGYIFTVRPIYQKQLLDEQIAERTVLLREATVNLGRLQKDEAKLKSDNAELAKEAEVTYARLRQNLLGQLTSASSSCAWRQFDDWSDGTKLLDCVREYVGENILPFLKPHDQESINITLEAYKKEIIGLPERLMTAQTADLTKATKEIARLEADINKNERNFIAQVNLLRNKNENADTKIKKLKDIKVLESSEETNAYLLYLQTHGELNTRLRWAEYDKITAGSNLSSSGSKELGKIMGKIADTL